MQLSRTVCVECCNTETKYLLSPTKRNESFLYMKFVCALKFYNEITLCSSKLEITLTRQRQQTFGQPSNDLKNSAWQNCF